MVGPPFFAAWRVNMGLVCRCCASKATFRAASIQRFLRETVR
jgi:hypothetical protein